MRGGGINLAWAAAEFASKPRLYKWDIILPLSAIQFEGYTFNSPNKIHEYLTFIYGDYMLFPREGAEHHDEGRGLLSGWAERNGINMDEVLEHLKDIERFFAEN